MTVNLSEFLEGLIAFGLYPPTGGGGGGTVTNVGTGLGLTGGPITTTGTISLSAIPVGDVLGNVGGFSAAPSGVSLTDLFDLVFNNVQGDILFRGASGWTYLPAGTAGYVLQTNGASADPTWVAQSTSGLAWVVVSGFTQNAAVNTGYIPTAVANTTFVMPATMAPGDTIRVLGSSSCPWTIQGNTGQNFQIGNVSSSVTGSVASTDNNDSIELICTTANTVWTIASGVSGDYTII